MRDLLLGVDVGTSSVKGAVLDAHGRTVAQAGSGAYAVHHPQPGWAEQDPDDWWHGVCQVTRELCPRETATRIAAVAISGQGCACTLLDASGTVLRPAITWMDTRAAAQAETLAKQHGATIQRLNGNAVGVYNVEPKLMWLRDYEPETLSRAVCSLTATAYVTHRLTGEAVMNLADGGILFAFDAAANDWSRVLLKELDISVSLYPPLVPSTSVVGDITAAAARDTGLPEGTPVVAGGEDTPSAALSVGIHRPDQAFLSLGTAGVIGICRAADTDWHESRLLNYPHVLDGLSISSGSMSSAGAAVEWMLGEFGTAYRPCHDDTPGPRDYSGFNDAVVNSPPGANGTIFLPYLSGELHPILNADARGMFFGLSTTTSRNDMARAILEGSAFATRHNLMVADAAGATANRLRATGSPTRSAPWCQAIADVTGQPIQVIEGSGAPKGNALLAGAGVGLIADPGQIAFELATVSAEYKPRDQYRSLYDDHFTMYLDLYEHLIPDFERMAHQPDRLTAPLAVRVDTEDGVRA